MKCSCCGEDRAPSTVAGLMCHDDIKVCRDCIGWLRSQAGVPDSTPILPVRNMDEAIEFYERAGFGVRRYEDGGFAFVSLEDESVFDLDIYPDTEPATNSAGCYLIVRNVDEWHARLATSGLPLTVVADQPWGMREFTLTDPSGNYVRIGQGS